MLAAALLVTSVVATARAADAASATGTWKWTVTRNDQSFDLVLELKQDGEKLSGSLSLPNGFSIDISEGKVKDGEVSFQTVFERDGNSFTTKYKGKVDGDTIKGKSERERNGEVVSRDWEAKREKK
jgi:hypothetical protein